MATATKKATAKKTATKKAAPKKAPSALKQLQARYPHVTKVVATGTKGNPTRVLVKCTADYKLDDCEKTRECATQDAFQVTRCRPCQREFAKRRRRKNPDA